MYIYIYIYITKLLNEACGPCGFSICVLCWASLAALAGSIRPLWASLAVLDRLLESFERPKSSDKAAKASLTRHFRRSGLDLGFDFRRFSQLFDVPSDGRLESLCPVPNLRFC